MSRVKVFCIIAIFILSGLAFSQPARAAENMKIGYVDYATLFQGYDKTKQAYMELKEKSQKKQKEGEELIENVRNMKNELELLTDKERDKKQMEIDEGIRKLQDFEREAKVDLDRERDNVEKEIFKEIEAVIDDYSVKNNYSMIVSDRIIIYAKEQYDITREILNLLNSKYRKTAK